MQRIFCNVRIGLLVSISSSSPNAVDKVQLGEVMAVIQTNDTGRVVQFMPAPDSGDVDHCTGSGRGYGYTGTMVTVVIATVNVAACAAFKLLIKGYRLLFHCSLGSLGHGRSKLLPCA